MSRKGGILGAVLLAVAGVVAWLALGRVVPEAPVPTSVITSPKPTFHLRLGHNIPETSALHAASVRFAAEVAQRTGGRVEVQVFPNQSLGTDDQMIEMAREGSLDMLLTPTAKLSASVPEMQYADLPFFFDSPAELYRMLDGAPGDLLLKRLARVGLVGVAFWENGFKHFTSNRPIHTPDDLRGQAIRVMKSRLIMDQFQALGANPIPIDFHATYQALADGAVDGQENPLVAIVGMGFHKVQSHLTLSSHGYLGYIFAISNRVFGALPVEVREALTETARGLTAWEREETARREQGFLAEIQAAGVKVHELTPEERHAFMERMAPLARQYESVIGPDLLAKTDELRWLARPEDERAQALVIGLNADLSTSSAIAGMAIRRGVEMAVAEINAGGGLLGRPLKLIARDHQAIPSQGARNLRELGAMPNLLAVVGGMHSWVVADELPVAQELGIPMLIPWAAATSLTEGGNGPNWAFRVSAPDAFVTPFLLQHAAAGGRRVAMLLERSAWGRSNEAAVAAWSAENGGQAPDIYWFNRGDEEFSPVAAEMAAKGTQALVLVANPNEAILILKALAERPAAPSIYAHWGLTGGDFWRQTRAYLDRVSLSFVQTVIIAPEPPERLRGLVGRYRDHYQAGSLAPIPAPSGTVQAYELVGLLARAVQVAGTSDRAAVRDALERLRNVHGVIRDYDAPFTVERHEALTGADLRLARFDALGRIVIAE